MEKEKIFAPEDFDKEPQKPKSGFIKWLIAAIVIIAAIIAIIFAFKGRESDNTNQVVEEITTETLVTEINTTDSSEVKNVDDLQKGDTQSVDSVPSVSKPNDNVVETKSNQQTTSTSTVSKTNLTDVEAEALKVIRGDYGNNPERKATLGDKYQPIQNRVNELKRQGFF